MYSISPPAVHAHELVMANPAYRRRVERVAASLREPREIITYRDADLPDLVLNKGILAGRKPMGSMDCVPDPILLFNTFRFDGEDRVRARSKTLSDAGIKEMPRSLLGTGAFVWFDTNLLRRK